MLNKAVLIGRLTKDVDYRVFESGNEVATFTLAVDRSFKDKNGERGADFIPIVAWGKTAELCGNYLGKGRQTAISGRIQTRTYEDKQGQTRYVTEIVAEEVTFLGSKKGEERAEQQGFTDMPNNNGYMDADEPF